MLKARKFCPAGGWRNALVFDPLVKYDGFSYYEVMLRPIAQALNAVITPDTQVSYSAKSCSLAHEFHHYACI